MDINLCLIFNSDIVQGYCENQSAMSKDIPYFDLPGGLKIPSFGLGTYGFKEEYEVEQALEAGYRHFDTATIYDTETIIGNVISRWIKAGKLKREDLYLVTKLPPYAMKPDAAHKLVQQSLKNLQVDYLDLYLIHLPVGIELEGSDLTFLEVVAKQEKKIDPSTDLIAIWKALEEEVRAGRIKSIGVSNFNIKQIQTLINIAQVPIANLQVELHVYHQQEDLVEFCKKNNITVTSYFTLGGPHLEELLKKLGKKVDFPDLLGNPVVKAIAAKHKKTPAQILLRHIHEKGLILIPKTSNKQRLVDNKNIFNFKLDSDDVAKLDGLDLGDGGKKNDFKLFPGILDHPEYPFAK